MEKPLSILLWHVLSLLCVLVVALLAIGKSSILECSAKTKPYAVVFQTRNLLGRANQASDRLIIFFGDSSVAQPPWAERDAPDIPTILQHELRKGHPEFGEVSVVTGAFNGARMFHYYCLLFEAEKYSPDLVIIPINWRSLGPKSPEWREKYPFFELSALVPLGERTFESGERIFQLEDIPPSRQLMYSLHRPLLYLRGLRMWTRIKLGMESKEEPLSSRVKELPTAEVMIGLFSDEELFRTYANEIAGDNSQLAILRSLVETSNRRGLKVLFYITPIHAQEMRRRPRFRVPTLWESIGRVVQAATSETSICLNLLELLGAEDFIDFYEHYKPEGNRMIATALVPGVQELIMLPERSPPHNCENNTGDER